MTDHIRQLLQSDTEPILDKGAEANYHCLTSDARECGSCTTSIVDLFKAAVFRDADFITLRKVDDDSPGLAVFLDILDDKQLLLLQRL
jgi:hypothetical protein